MYIISEVNERIKTNIVIIPEYDRSLIISMLYRHVLGKDGVGESNVKFSFFSYHNRDEQYIHLEYYETNSREPTTSKKVFQIEEIGGIYNIQGRLKE